MFTNSLANKSEVEELKNRGLYIPKDLHNGEFLTFSISLIIWSNYHYDQIIYRFHLN